MCEFQIIQNKTRQYNGAHASASPGGRLHDYWQQASKRGAAKEVRFPCFRPDGDGERRVCVSVYPVCRPKFGSAKVRALWHSSLFSNRLNHECPSLLVVSHRASRSRKNRLVVESPLIEDVFVWCTLFLRMYIHRVSSRHWPSPLTHQDAARIEQGLLLTSSPMAKSQKKPGGGAPSR